MEWPERRRLSASVARIIAPAALLKSAAEPRRTLTDQWPVTDVPR